MGQQPAADDISCPVEAGQIGLKILVHQKPIAVQPHSQFLETDILGIIAPAKGLKDGIHIHFASIGESDDEMIVNLRSRDNLGIHKGP